MSPSEALLTLLSAALKAGVLLALAAGLVAALRRASARTRQGVWAVALAGALLVPALSPWMPEWSVAALPLPIASVDRPAPAAVAPRPASGDGLGIVPEPGVRPAGSDAAATRRSAREGLGAGLADLRARAAGVPLAVWLLAVWLVGCLASIALFLRSFHTARRLGRGTRAASGPWRRELAEVGRLLGLGRRVELVESGEAVTPMTWGWLRPVILVPTTARRWSSERRRIVLLHELVHVRRGDWPLRLLARLVCSVYWFNPLAWLAARRLAVEQEVACDEEVVALGTRPSAYAHHLLAIARALGPSAPSPAHALDMAGRSQMEGRLMSILDGGRCPRGGRKLAILALLLIAGLVPALAAIEPWVEERDLGGQSSGSESAGQPATADAEGVARVLGELEALERRMEPFEVELEAVEVEMGPIEAELEGIEVEMEPVEVELESFETELEPYEAMLEQIEVEMEPHQARLEAIEAELEPFEERFEAFEVEMRPLEQALEAIEVEMAPFEEALEAIEVEMEPLERELEGLSEQLEPLAEAGPGSEEMERLAARMREVHERMAPLHERMAAIQQEMEPIHERMSEAHQAMEPIHERMGAIHQEMAPVFERMAAVHEDLEPLRQRMAEVHERMEPVFERMGAAHERMTPFHERMGEYHERMEPHHLEMAEIHERIRPLHEEMGQRHEELERELAGLVERMLAVELAGVTAAATDYAPAAARIVDAVSLNVDDGVLRVMSSGPELREILSEALAGQVTATEDEFAAAVDRFVRALGGLEVRAQG